MAHNPVADITLARIFLYIDSNDGVTRNEIVKDVKVALATVGSALNELRTMGCIESERVKWTYYNYSTGHGCDFCK